MLVDDLTSCVLLKMRMTDLDVTLETVVSALETILQFKDLQGFQEVTKGSRQLK